MPAIRITIGAKLDASAVNVFAPLIAKAEQARAKISSIGAHGAEEFVGGYRSAPARTKKGFDGVAGQAETSAKKIAAASRKAAKDQEKDAEHVFQIKQRYLAQEAAAVARLAAQNQKTFAKGRADAAAYQAAQGTARRGVLDRGASGAVGAAKGAIGVAGQFARGAGVETDLASSVGRGVELHSKAADIVNQLKLNGQNPGAGEANSLVDISRKVGNDKGIGANEVMGVLGDFQAKSSDLETGKTVVADLAELAKATGTQFKDMGAAAGFVNAQLADGPDKAKQLLAIMRLTTAQTAAGSVEMEDFASQMPKVAAAANMFGGDYAENLGQLTALAQMSIKGGKMNGSQAATAAGNIGRDINKGQTIKAWAGQGLDVFTDKTHKNIKSPEQLIMESLDKTGGDKGKFAALWKSSTSSAPANAALKVFNDAGGGKAGHAAVQAEFDKYKQTVSPEQIKEMAASKMNDTGAKVARFNNELDRIADSAAAKVLPALEKLAPSLIGAADGLGQIAGYAAENPVKSAIALFGAAITKEVAAAGLKKGIESALSSSLGAAGGGVLLIAGAIMTITDATITMTAKAEDKARDASVSVENTRSELRMAGQTGNVAQSTLDDEAKAQMELEQRIKAAENADNFNSANPLKSLIGDVSGAVNYVTAGSAGTSFATQADQGQDAANLGALKAQLEGMKAESAKVHLALTSGTMKVMVMNPAAMGAAQPGTTGPVPP